MTPISHLKDRLSAAAQGSREMDCEIALLTGWTVHPGDNWIGPHGEIAVPAYTADLGAVVDLIGRKLRPLHPHMTMTLRGILSGPAPPDYWFAEITWPSHERQGRAYTPALALLLAILEAIEASHGG